MLDQEGIPLRLVSGADIHMVSDFVAGLRSGHLLSLTNSRYVLVEPPHHIAPIGLEELLFGLLVAGYVPILTHPERLAWIVHHSTIARLARGGVWMQVTAGSLAGAFGRNAQYWACRMLDEGDVHILATDAHDIERRLPNLSEGRELAAKRVGRHEAERFVTTRPAGILQNEAPSSLLSARGDGGDAALRSDLIVIVLAACVGSLAGCGASLPNELAGDPAQNEYTRQQVGTDFAVTNMPVRLPREAELFVSMSAPGNTAYKIGPQDVLDVSVFKVPELSRSVQVADAGSVNLPLLGDVPVAGKTARKSSAIWFPV